MKLYNNTAPYHLRQYKVVVKKYSGNIYLVNENDINDFFQFNGDSYALDTKRVYNYTELIISGSYAKVKAETFAKRKNYSY